MLNFSSKQIYYLFSFFVFIVNKKTMGELFNIEDVKKLYPETVVNGEIDLKSLSLVLLRELNDIQEQLNEKDYQILRITERLDKLDL